MLQVSIFFLRSVANYKIFEFVSFFVKGTFRIKVLYSFGAVYESKKDNFFSKDEENRKVIPESV